MANSTIITEEQLAQLREAKARIPQIEEEIRLAERAGINVSAQKAELETLKNQIEALLRVYDTPSSARRNRS